MSRQPGRVIRIRVNPKDCMSAIDVAQAAGVYVKGMSFAQVCSIAFSAMLGTLRMQGTIKDRDGFEYAEMMAQFPDQPHIDRARKLSITNAFRSAGGDAVLPTIGQSTQLDTTMARKRTRYEELAFKLNEDPLNVTEEEHKEFKELVSELFDKS